MNCSLLLGDLITEEAFGLAKCVHQKQLFLLVECNQQEIRKIVQDYKKGTKVVVSEIESIDTLIGIFKYVLEHEGTIYCA